MKTIQHVRRVRRPGSVRGAYVRHVQPTRVLYAHTATMIPDGMHGIEDGYHNDGWRAGRPVVVRANVATMIPDGMHAAVFLDKRRILDDIVEGLVAKGVDPYRARVLVNRIALQRQTGSPSGLGDETSVDSSVLARASDTQSQHKSLLSQYASATSDADRLGIRNEIDALYSDWTQYAVGVEGGQPPMSWSLTDPTAAVLAAVRNDIRNTVDLIDAGKAQSALQKSIVASWNAQGGGGGGGFLPKIEVPWYVWAGGAGVGLLALHQMFRK